MINFCLYHPYPSDEIIPKIMYYWLSPWHTTVHATAGSEGIQVAATSYSLAPAMYMHRRRDKLTSRLSNELGAPSQPGISVWFESTYAQWWHFHPESVVNCSCILSHSNHLQFHYVRDVPLSLQANPTSTSGWPWSITDDNLLILYETPSAVFIMFTTTCIVSLAARSDTWLSSDLTRA